MDGGSSIPMVVSFGALATTGMISWYLNGRISELEQHTEALKTNVATVVLKYTQDMQVVGDIGPFKMVVEKTLQAFKNDMDMIKEVQLKLMNTCKLHSQAITELQDFIKQNITEDYDFEHTIPVVKSHKKKKKKFDKRSRKVAPSSSSSDSEDNTSVVAESSDSEKSDDVEKQMKRVKSTHK
jgi:hypothetical protein